MGISKGVPFKTVTKQHRIWSCAVDNFFAIFNIYKEHIDQSPVEIGLQEDDVLDG